MRISDWSSDVCSSDRAVPDYRKGLLAHHDGVEHRCVEGGGHDHAAFLEQASRLGGVLPPPDVVTDGSELGDGPRHPDRKRVVSGTSVSVRVVLGGRRSIHTHTTLETTVAPTLS